MRLIYCVLIAWVLIGCTQSLDSPAKDEEMINGFNVTWAFGTTMEQKQAIRFILSMMVFVQEGVFMMGNDNLLNGKEYGYAYKDEFPSHLVGLTSFYICKDELAYDLVSRIKGYTSSLSYDRSIDFLLYLNSLTGLNFTLPTEAQWEYAARGGRLSKGYLYSGTDNYDETRDEFLENELGLIRMSSGLGEYCLDAYNNYSGDFQVNPLVLAGDQCVVRGYGDRRVLNREQCKKTSPNTNITCRPVININNSQ